MTFRQAHLDQIKLITQAHDADKARLEAALRTCREREGIAAELTQTKQELATTSSMLRDSRTELRIATSRHSSDSAFGDAFVGSLPMGTIVAPAPELNLPVATAGHASRLL